LVEGGRADAAERERIGLMEDLGFFVLGSASPVSVESLVFLTGGSSNSEVRVAAKTSFVVVAFLFSIRIERKLYLD
jgi:hypothetical protein